MISYEEIFNVIEDLDKNKDRIYRLQFKHDLSLLKPDGMAITKYKAWGLAKRWIWKNQKKADDIAFELQVLRDK